MLLFTPILAAMVKAGLKWQTRRLWKNARVKKGGHYYCQLNLKPESRFARIEVTEVHQWDGKTISDEDAIAEGFGSPEAFLTTYRHLNANRLLDEDRKHYAIHFKVLETYETIPDVPTIEQVKKTGVLDEYNNRT